MIDEINQFIPSVVLTFLDTPSTELLSTMEMLIDKLETATGCQIQVCPSSINSTTNCQVVSRKTTFDVPHQILANSLFPLLRLILSQLPSTSNIVPIAVLGIFSATDLFPHRDIDYTLGQADTHGPVAVASIARIQSVILQQNVTSEKKQILLASSVEKLLLHELGHVFGLLHCNQSHSVCRMRPVSGPNHLLTNNISTTFCIDCQENFLLGRDRLLRHVVEAKEQSAFNPI